MDRKQRERNQKKEKDITVKAKVNRQQAGREIQQGRGRQPISWRNSEGLYHIHEKPLASTESMTGLYEGNSISEKKRTREIFRAENSYGNIAIGVNQNKEAMLVVSQKREHNSVTTEGKKRELQTERAKRKRVSKGSFLTNPGREKDGAAAYQVDANMKEQKVLSVIEKMAKSQDNIMFEERMPFLSLDRDKRARKELREQIRRYREKKETTKADILEKEKQSLESIMQQKEEQERVMKRKIKSAWKKMQGITTMDVDQVRGKKNNVEKIEDLEEEKGNDEENNEESSEKNLDT